MKFISKGGLFMNEKFYQELACELKEARISKNFTQEYVAERINVTRSCIATWERGTRQITFDDVFKLCVLYELDINQLANKIKKYL